MLEEAEGHIYSATDIPEAARRRLVAGERYHAKKRLKLIFTSYPHGPDAKTDVVALHDICPGNAMNIAQTRGEHIPDVVFSPCHAAFFDDEKGTYHYIHATKFYFPIPRA